MDLFFALAADQLGKMNCRETLVIIFLEPSPFGKRNTFLNEKGAERFILLRALTGLFHEFPRVLLMH